MYRKWIFTVAFCCAWVSFGQRFSVNATLGGNVLPVEKDQFGINLKPGYHGGVGVTYQLTDDWSISSGIDFTHKRHTYAEFDTSQLNLFGFEEQLPVEDVDLSIYSRSKSSVNQYYLELPVMGTYQFRRLQFSLGGYFSYMLFARSRIEEETRVPALQVIDISQFDPDGQLSAFLPDPYTYSIRDSKSKGGLFPFDYGLRAGIGMEVDKLQLSARYNYRLTDFRTQSVSDIGYQRHYFQLALTYTFFRF